MKNVGFIGLGVMGKPMVKNLLEAGFSVTVYDTRPQVVSELAALGALTTKSARELAEKTEIMILMVATAAQVNDVLFGEGDAAAGLKNGSTVVIMSTIEPTAVKSAAEALQKNGVRVLDAPVYRGVSAAEAGTLGLLIGGDEQCLEECRPVLEAMSSDIYHCGGIGSGEMVKIVNNYIVINSTLLISEAVLTGVKYGIEPERLIELLKAGSANSWALSMWSDLVLNRKFSPPVFDFDMAMKDTGLGLATAKELKVPTPIGALCHQMFQVAGANGRNKLDFTSWITWLEEMTGVEVKKKTLI